MSNIFITSDTHFGHDRDFIYSTRGYDSESSASRAIVDNINFDVKENDELYILGDVLLGNDDSFEYLNWFLCHYPVYTNNYNGDYHSFDALWSLCGHIHTKDPFLELKKGIMSYHCELDAHNNHPVSIKQIKRDILA